MRDYNENDSKNEPEYYNTVRIAAYLSLYNKESSLKYLNKYRSPDEWLHKYIYKLIKYGFRALKDNGVMLLDIQPSNLYTETIFTPILNTYNYLIFESVFTYHTTDDSTNYQIYVLRKK